MSNNKGDFEAFKTALGHRESSGRYTIVNRWGFTGKYQMGEALLMDLGYYRPQTDGDYYPGGKNSKCEWRGNWLQKANGLGVWTHEDFKNNVGNIQEIVILEAFQHNTRLMENSLGRRGLNLANCLGPSRYTYSGMLAAAHLGGAGGAVKLLVDGRDGRDQIGTSVSEYAGLFSNYEVADALGFPHLRGL